MASLQSLRDLFVEELKDIYNAEQQILKALPKMRKAATNPRLVTAIDEHMDQTKTHVDRLERIFDEIQESPRGKKCKGMEGLIEEGKEVLDAHAADEARDAGIIAAAQKIEHYEIAAYGTASAHARASGLTVAEQLLEQTLEEEKETDRLLTEIAEGGINEWAVEAETEMTTNGRSMSMGRTNGRGTNARATNSRGANERAGSRASSGTSARDSGTRRMSGGTGATARAGMRAGRGATSSGRRSTTGTTRGRTGGKSGRSGMSGRTQHRGSASARGTR